MFILNDEVQNVKLYVHKMYSTILFNQDSFNGLHRFRNSAELPTYRERVALLTFRSVYFRAIKLPFIPFNDDKLSPFNQEKYLPFLTGLLRAELKLELLLFSPSFVPLQFCQGSSNMDCLKYSLAGGFQGPLPPPPPC